MRHPKSQHGGSGSGGDLVRAVVEKIVAGDRGAAEALVELVTDCPKKSDASGSSSGTARIFFHSLLQSVARSCSLEDTEWCLTLMSDKGVQLTISVINSMLHACARVGNIGVAEKWLLRMPSNGLSPNVVSFNTMINTCARSMDTKRAEVWFKKMQEQGVAPTRVTFGSLVDAFAKVGKLKEAEAWAQKIVDAGMEFDQIIYNSLLHAAAKSGNQAKAAHWLQQMIDNSFVPNEKAFTSLILTCSKSGDLLRATHWFKLMVNSGCKVDMICFSSMINVSARVGDSQQAEHWMEQLVEHGFAPNMICYNTLLHACARDGNYQRAVKWVAWLLESNMVPNEITFNTMIQVSASAGSQRDSEFWLIRMICEGYWPDKMSMGMLSRMGNRHAPPTPGARNLPGWVNAAVSAARRQVGGKRKAPRGAQQLASAPPHQLAAEETPSQAPGADDVEKWAKEVCSKPLRDLLREGNLGAGGGFTTLSQGVGATNGGPVSVPSAGSRQRPGKKAFDASKFGTWPSKSMGSSLDASNLPGDPAYESQSLPFASVAEEGNLGAGGIFTVLSQEGGGATTGGPVSIPSAGSRQRPDKKAFDASKFGTWPSKSMGSSLDASSWPSISPPAYESTDDLPFASVAEECAARGQPSWARTESSSSTTTAYSSQQTPVQTAVHGHRRAGQSFNLKKFGTWPHPGTGADGGGGASHFQSTQTEESSSNSVASGLSPRWLDSASFPPTAPTTAEGPLPAAAAPPPSRDAGACQERELDVCLGSHAGGGGASSQLSCAALAAPRKKPNNSFDFSKFATWPARVVSPIQEQEHDTFGSQRAEAVAQAAEEACYLGEAGDVSLPRESAIHPDWAAEVRCGYGGGGGLGASGLGAWPAALIPAERIGMPTISSSSNGGENSVRTTATIEDCLPEPHLNKFRAWPAPAERVLDVDGPDPCAASLAGSQGPTGDSTASVAGRRRRAGGKTPLDLSKFGTWPRHEPYLAEGQVSSIISSIDKFGTDFFEAPHCSPGALLAGGGAEHAQEGAGWPEQCSALLAGSGSLLPDGGAAASSGYSSSPASGGVLGVSVVSL